MEIFKMNIIGDITKEHAFYFIGGILLLVLYLLDYCALEKAILSYNKLMMDVLPDHDEAIKNNVPMLLQETLSAFYRNKADTARECYVVLYALSVYACENKKNRTAVICGLSCIALCILAFVNYTKILESAELCKCIW